MEPEGFSTHFRLSGAVDRGQTYCWDCPPDCLPRQQIFSKTSKLSYYFIVKNVCKAS